MIATQRLLTLVALSAASMLAVAQTDPASDTARQERMDAAYRDWQQRSADSMRHAGQQPAAGHKTHAHHKTEPAAKDATR
jgi:hypothetical protein